MLVLAGVENYLQDLPVLVSTFLLCISLYFSKSALSPRLKGPIESSIFFGKISEVQIEAFRRKVAEAVDADVEEDLANQIHRNAEIAHQKHKNIGKSIVAITLGIPFWIVAIVVG